MLESIKAVSISKMGFTGVKKIAKDDSLPQAISEPGLQKDVFQKQNKLNSICALTDGYATPAMV